MENVLVTGGAGFIGSHLVDVLLKRTDISKVIVVDNLSMSDGKYVTSINDIKLCFENKDAADYDTMSFIINKYSVSTIFHLATSPLVFSLKDPRIAFNNIVGMQQVLLECQRQGFFGKLISFSTSEVYGSSDGMVLKETDRLYPRTPYAAAKVASDMLTKSYGESFGIDYTIIRPFNNYGPRKQTFYQGAGIIPTTIKRLAGNKKISVYGDGSCSRDFVFVEDTVKATILAWKSDSCTREILNIANTNAHSVLKIIQDIAKIMGIDKPEIEFLEARPGDVSYLCGDGTKIKQILGFTPETSWENGLKKCVDYYSQKTFE